MAALTVQNVARTGLAPTYAAAAGGGDTFVNDGQTFVHVKNGGGSSVNVTVDSTAPATVGLAQSDVVVAVPASGERMIGPFPPNAFDDVNGSTAIAYSAVTSVTVAAVRLAN